MEYIKYAKLPILRTSYRIVERQWQYRKHEIVAIVIYLIFFIIASY